MSVTANPALIRPPLPVRIYVAAFTCVWCGLLVAFGVVAAVDGKPVVIVPMVFFVIFGVLLGVRMLRVSVTLEPEALIVRGLLKTRRVQRVQIEGFRAGVMSTQPFGKTIYALLRDGSVVPLEVAGRLYRFGRGPALLTQRLNQLERWLAAN